MQKYFTLISALLFSACLFAQNEPIQPFEELGIRVKVLTLSNGKYQESFPNDTIFRFGSAMFNRVTGEVVSIVVDDTLYGEYNLKPEVVSRWLSPDPLAADFPSWSPYTYTYNNPILYVDPDGRSGIASIDTKNKTITITSHFFVYGSGADADVASTFASSIQNMWNAANGVVNIGGTDYKVVFAVTAQAVSEADALSWASANKADKNFALNFARIENSFTKEAQNYPNSDGTNSIMMATRHVCAEPTTPAHEYGHSLGHMAHEKPGEKIDGQPNIFSTIHNPVDAPYTVNPSQGPTQMTIKDGKIVPGSVVNPLDKSKRMVTQQDIDYLHLDKLKFDALGKANVGDIDNVIFDANGQRKN